MQTQDFLKFEANPGKSCGIDDIGPPFEITLYRRNLSLSLMPRHPVFMKAEILQTANHVFLNNRTFRSRNFFLFPLLTTTMLTFGNFFKFYTN